jgi:hypothetical protein
VLKNRVNDAGYHATLGNANWFTVGAVAAMLLATCASFFGACGRFATGRAAGEKVSHTGHGRFAARRGGFPTHAPRVMHPLTAVLNASTLLQLQAAYNRHAWAMFTRQWSRDRRGAICDYSRLIPPMHDIEYCNVARWERVRRRGHGGARGDEVSGASVEESCASCQNVCGQNVVDSQSQGKCTVDRHPTAPSPSPAPSHPGTHPSPHRSSPPLVAAVVVVGIVILAVLPSLFSLLLFCLSSPSHSPSPSLF